jgi:hypothetical protein
VKYSYLSRNSEQPISGHRDYIKNTIRIKKIIPTIYICTIMSTLLTDDWLTSRILPNTSNYCTALCFSYLPPSCYHGNNLIRPLVDALYFTRCQMCWFLRQPTAVSHIKSQVLGKEANPVCWSRCELWKIRTIIINETTIITMLWEFNYYNAVRVQSTNRSVSFIIWLVIISNSSYYLLFFCISDNNWN